MTAKILAAIAVLGGWCAPAAAQDMKLIHSERSLYRDVLVYEYSGQRCICFTRQCRVGRQSCYELTAPNRFVMNYTRMIMGGSLFMTPDPKRILIVGLGGGTLPTALAKVLPQSHIDVVEIDPAVTRVAKQYFAFHDGPNMRVIEADGRVYVKRALREKQTYDLVMLDAFDHEYIPEHLLTQEWLTEVKGLLKPGGVLAANTFSSSRLYDHESTTYASVFGPFYNLKRENRVILTRIGGNTPRAELRANAAKVGPQLTQFGVETDWVLEQFNDVPDWNVSARVLTDQFSPANLLNR